MSRLNILMELRGAIVDWAAGKIDRNAGTERLPAMRMNQDVLSGTARIAPPPLPFRDRDRYEAGT
jgi:hypothetical protein